MWTRRELKQRAKAVLRTNYWKALLVGIVTALAIGGGGGSAGRDSARGAGGYHGGPFSSFTIDNQFISVIMLTLAAAFVVIVLAAACRILLGFPLETGGRRYFIQSASYNDNSKCFRFAFRGENYKGIVLTMLLKGIYNFLWFLLFIIPGIVKYYSYSMVPYILADNPNIGATKAITLSRKMTSGQKFDMFVLDISFIGWYLLGVLALGIGVLFVIPYDFATKAELYLALRQEALDRNYCTMSDLALLYKYDQE